MEFFQTVAGQRFFNEQFPQMVSNLEKNTSSMERLTELLEKQNALLEEQNRLLAGLQNEQRSYTDGSEYFSVLAESQNEQKQETPEIPAWDGIRNGLKYWSNATGDLFRPGEARKDWETIKEGDLPVELRSAYRKLWNEDTGSYCYLVELDGAYGVALVNEYGKDFDPPEDAFTLKDIENRVTEVKKMLEDKQIPFMKAYVEEDAGVKGYDDLIGEMIVVLPWDSKEKNFEKVADFLYEMAYNKDASYEDYKTWKYAVMLRDDNEKKRTYMESYIGKPLDKVICYAEKLQANRQDDGKYIEIVAIDENNCVTHDCLWSGGERETLELEEER